MAEEKAPERSVGPSDVEVISVTISVLPADERRQLLERLAGVGVLGRGRAFLAAGVVLAALGAIVAIGSESSHGRAPRADRADLQGTRASRAPAFGYPYPPRCMSMTISDIKPVYVAEVERANGCVGYDGSVTASFHRAHGSWTLRLGEPQLFASNSLPASSLGCLTLAVVIHDPSFMGPDQAMCARGHPVWLR